MKLFNLTQFRRYSFYLAAVFVVLAMLSIGSKGLNLALDFTGGYLTEFSTAQSFKVETMQQYLNEELPNGFQVTSANNGTEWSVIQPDSQGSLKGKQWLQELASNNDINITPRDAIYIGSQVGEELKEQGGLAFLTAVLVILIYLALRFEWRFSIAAVVALFHDVLIVLGIFSWFSIPFDLTILAAILAIIGYSLNDSIVVSDKIREMMQLSKDKEVNDIINLAVQSTMVRTLVTSGTTLVTILAIGYFAGSSLQGFAIALFVGILIGTLSSIAIAATLPQLLGLSHHHYEPEVLVDELP